MSEVSVFLCSFFFDGRIGSCCIVQLIGSCLTFGISLWEQEPAEVDTSTAVATGLV